MKICSRCKKEKTFSEFRIRKASPDGFSFACKTCLNKRFEIQCTVQKSRFCKKIYFLTNDTIRANLKSNAGEYRCKYCAIQDTHLGEKSHFNKHFIKYENFFDEIDTESKAYLLGLIAGDGTITDDNKIGICANIEDSTSIELFKTNLCPDAKIYKNGNCLITELTSLKLVQDVCRHLKINPGKKSDKIVLPDLSKNFYSHFIRGLMDSDGSIANPNNVKSKYANCFYSSTSKKILEQVANICDELKINYCLTGIKIEFNGQWALKFMAYIYNNATVYLPRKYNYFLGWKNLQNNKH